MVELKSLSKSLIIISIIFIMNIKQLLTAGVCQDQNCNICNNYDYSNTCTECKEGYFVTDKNDCSKCMANCQICKSQSSYSSSKTSTSYCKVCSSGYYLNSIL